MSGKTSNCRYFLFGYSYRENETCSRTLINSIYGKNDICWKIWFWVKPKKIFFLITKKNILKKSWLFQSIVIPMWVSKQFSISFFQDSWNDRRDQPRFQKSMKEGLYPYHFLLAEGRIPESFSQKGWVLDHSKNPESGGDFGSSPLTKLN